MKLFIAILSSLVLTAPAQASVTEKVKAAGGVTLSTARKVAALTLHWTVVRPVKLVVDAAETAEEFVLQSATALETEIK